MRIMYALCSWGYGHVTRSLPIIRKLIKEGHEMTFVVHGPPKYMLEQEIGHLENQVRIADVEDYPLPYTHKKQAFLFKFMAYTPKMLYMINKENDWVVAEARKTKYDLIMSDNRYGIYHPKIPSFLMTHQLRMIAPNRVRLMEWSTEKFVSYFQRYFKNYIVPDFEDDSLAGALCHDLNLYEKDKVAYIGAISDFPSDRTKEKDLDGYISISGPEPSRSEYEKIIRSHLEDLKGKWIMSLGSKKGEEETIGDVTIYPYLTTEMRTDVLNRTDLVVSRSGYTTMMDLCMGGQKAVFSPTPGQTEQIYLSDFHNEKGTWFSVHQDDIDLIADIKKAKSFTGVKRGSTEKAVENTMDILFG